MDFTSTPEDSGLGETGEATDKSQAGLSKLSAESAFAIRNWLGPAHELDLSEIPKAVDEVSASTIGVTIPERVAKILPQLTSEHDCWSDLARNVTGIEEDPTLAAERRMKNKKGKSVQRNTVELAREHAFVFDEHRAHFPNLRSFALFSDAQSVNDFRHRITGHESPYAVTTDDTGQLYHHIPYNVNGDDIKSTWTNKHGIFFQAHSRTGLPTNGNRPLLLPRSQYVQCNSIELHQQQEEENADAFMEGYASQLDDLFPPSQNGNGKRDLTKVDSIRCTTRFPSQFFKVLKNCDLKDDLSVEFHPSFKSLGQCPTTEEWCSDSEFGAKVPPQVSRLLLPAKSLDHPSIAPAWRLPRPGSEVYFHQSCEWNQAPDPINTEESDPGCKFLTVTPRPGVSWPTVDCYKPDADSQTPPTDDPDGSTDILRSLALDRLQRPNRGP